MNDWKRIYGKFFKLWWSFITNKGTSWCLPVLVVPAKSVAFVRSYPAQTLEVTVCQFSAIIKVTGDLSLSLIQTGVTSEITLFIGLDFGDLSTHDQIGSYSRY